MGSLGERGPNADRQRAYQAPFVAEVNQGELAEIRDCTHKGWALGGERFRAEIEALGQRRAASKGVGRPRKRDDNRV
jgi:putative transposase